LGAKSKLNVSERREVVLSLLRREEPAGMMARRFEGGFLFGRAVPLGVRRPRCDELFGQPILTRPPVRATQPWGLLQPHAGSIRSKCVSISFTVRNLTQNHRNFFHLNCVPRHVYSHLTGSQISGNILNP